MKVFKLVGVVCKKVQSAIKKGTSGANVQLHLLIIQDHVCKLENPFFDTLFSLEEPTAPKILTKMDSPSLSLAPLLRFAFRAPFLVNTSVVLF